MVVSELITWGAFDKSFVNPACQECREEFFDTVLRHSASDF